MSAHVWPCGHPRTSENTRKVGVAGVRCRECRKAIDKKDWLRRGPAVNASRKAIRLASKQA